MNRRLNPLFFVVLAMVGGVMAQGADAPVPLPKSKALPMNVKPGPGTGVLGSADRGFVNLDLSKYGFTEDEYIISGNANVYDWPQGGALTAKTSGPYATRVLVRHPKDPAKFSGTVVVELGIYSRRMDWPQSWGYLQGAILERGDAWVLVTMPGGIAGFLKYNPSRYGEMGFRNPAPIPGGCPEAGNRYDPNMEDGLKYDMISQVGAAVKSGLPGYPLYGYKVQDLLVTSQLGELSTYMAAIHPHAKLADGKYVFDGYMPKSLGAQVAARKISQCDGRPVPGDARFIPHNLGVPVISVTPQSEVIESYKERRPDSDTPGDQFRAYEIAGGMHLTKSSYDNIPSLPDQAVAGSANGTVDWPQNGRCSPEVPMNESPLLDYSFHAALVNLDNWVKKGVAPPKAARIKITDGPNPEVVLDKYGNGEGGVRTFFVDLPTATYVMTSGPTGVCHEWGHTIPFGWGKDEAIYGSYKNYSAKVAQSVDQSVKEHWLTESDGKFVKANLKIAAESPVTGPPVNVSGALR